MTIPNFTGAPPEDRDGRKDIMGFDGADSGQSFAGSGASGSIIDR